MGYVGHVALELHCSLYALSKYQPVRQFDDGFYLGYD